MPDKKELRRMFRLLRADEIECRVATVKENGCSVLLYKDARCDQNILDETVGNMNWQRKHSRENANCTVGIWDTEKKIWVEKEDTGTESFTEKEKGLASDSFKRACFNWGIGRELYTAPFIWIKAGDCEIKPKGQGYTTSDRFDVKDIGYDDNGVINRLVIVNNSKNGKTVFVMGKKDSRPEKTADEKAEDQMNKNLQKKITKKELAILNNTLSNDQAAWVLENFGIGDLSDLTAGQYAAIFQTLNKRAKNGK